MYFRRESLFRFENINELIDIPDEFYERMIFLQEEIIKLEQETLRLVHDKMEKLYKVDDKNELKRFMKLKRSVRNNKMINLKTIGDQRIESLLYQHRKSTEKLNKLKTKFQEIYNSKSRNYNFFINSPFFREALKDTNKNYMNILDENNKKFRKEKTIYNYVQRSTVKISPLSYFGTTVFVGNQQEMTHIKIGNVVYFALFLYILSHIESMKMKLKYNLGKLIQFDNSPEVVCHDKIFFSSNFDWIIKRDDYAYNRTIIKLFKEYFENKEFLNGGDIDFLIKENPLIDFDFLISTNLIKIDYNYYLTNKEQLQILFNENLLSDKHNIREFIMGNIEKVDDVQFMIEFEQLNACQQNVSSQKRITSFLKNQPLYYHNTYRLDDLKKDNKISFSDFEDLITENYFYNYYTSCLLYVSKHYNINNLFEILNFIKINNSKLKNEIKLENLGTTMKKSVLVFLQNSEDGKFVLNNIHVGTGTIVARDLFFLKNNSPENFDLYHKKIKRNFDNNFPIYELILDMEISSKIGHLDSRFPKIFFENDIQDLEFRVIDNVFQIYYQNQPINLIYTGTIPYYMFSGIKRILLELLHPYSVDFQKFKNSNLSRKGISILDKREFQEVQNMSSIDFFIFIKSYFKNLGLPRDFFLTENKPFRHSKPVWFSLNSSNSLSILKRILPKSNFILNEVFPNDFKGKTIEHVYWLTKEE